MNKLETTELQEACQVIKTLQGTVEHVNRKNGWHEDNDSSSKSKLAHLMLIVTEVSEACEAIRNGVPNNDVSKVLEMKPTSEFKFRFESDIKNSEGDELADVLIRVLDYATRHKINLADHVAAKIMYNATRGYKHGNKKI